MARTQEIEIQTRLGLRRIDISKKLYFPRGLAGFEGLHEFTLLQIQPEAPLLILQSLDKADVGLLVADPFSFMSDYHINLGEAEQNLLLVKDPRQVAVLVTVTIPNGRPADTTLNLTGPILINHEARLGLQVPQMDSEYPGQVRISDLPCNAPKAGEAQQGEAAPAADAAPATGPATGPTTGTDTPAGADGQ